MIAPARPATVEELAQVVAEGPYRVTGSNSMPPLEVKQERSGTRQISMLKMNKVLHLDAAQRTVRVNAGISFDALQQHLAWRNLWIPLDPPALGGRRPGHRTVGGLLATDSRGPLAMRQSWRHIAASGKWVDHRGHIHEGAISTVIGHLSEHGILAEVTLMAETRPADERMLVAYCADAEQADALCARLHSHASVAYVEIAGAGTFKGNPLELPADGMIVLAGVLGNGAEEKLEDIRQLASGIETIGQMAVPAARMRLWLTSEPEGTFGFRISYAGHSGASLVGALERLARETGASCWLVCDAGIGQIRGIWTGTNSIGRIGERMVAAGGRCQLTWISERLTADERVGLLEAWGD